jgi:lipid II:glycine glycyltransferase (peptidoglycan interpeptide bridge formation enzyme)
MPILSASDWEAYLTHFPDAHLLQTAAWGELKASFGWQARRVAVGETCAQVLLRRLPLGLTLAYIPKGPLGPDWPRLWPEVDRLCRKERAVLLKVEPDAWEPVPAALDECLPGFLPGQPAIQPRCTVVVDLEGSEEGILARMKQKTRYNIRLAQKKEVEVHPTGNLDAFYRLMVTTGQRDGFGVHSLEYYRRAYQLFSPRDECCLLQADYAGQPLAALMVFMCGKRAWYFYGASSNLERNRMPAYLLQWHAMLWARQHGCLEYDLWGVPDQDERTLEANFEQRQDGLWGVYRFKRGFGGQLQRSAGAWDRVYLPVFYTFYRWWLKRRGAAL